MTKSKHYNNAELITTTYFSRLGMTIVSMHGSSGRGRTANGSFISLYKGHPVFRLNKNMSKWVEKHDHNHVTLGVEKGQIFFCFDKNDKSIRLRKKKNGRIEFYSKSAAEMIRQQTNTDNSQTIRMYKTNKVKTCKRLNFYSFKPNA